jgi:hypothetical protein
VKFWDVWILREQNPAAISQLIIELTFLMLRWACCLYVCIFPIIPERRDSGARRDGRFWTRRFLCGPSHIKESSRLVVSRNYCSIHFNNILQFVLRYRFLSSSNASDLHWGNVRFESRPEQWPSWLDLLVIFPSSSVLMLGEHLRIRNDLILAHPFHSIIH